jgi:hypothetical protein
MSVAGASRRQERRDAGSFYRDLRWLLRYSEIQPEYAGALVQVEAG